MPSVDLRSQRDQLERLAALIPALRGANARPSPSDAKSGPSANPPAFRQIPPAHRARERKITPLITVRYGSRTHPECPQADVAVGQVVEHAV